MSGAQAKAAVIAGCVGVVAEVHKNNVIVLIKLFYMYLGWLEDINTLLKIRDLLNVAKGSE